MIFWRKKKNATEQEQQEKEDKIVHHPEEPAIEPPTEYEAEITEDQAEEIFEETETEILEDIEETPVPEEPEAVRPTAEEPEKAEDGGWFGRLTKGLSKSSAKLGQGITDLVTKKKLDQDMLDELEDLLIMADLGPQTSASLVDAFGKGRFGKDISEDEVKDALAEQIGAILSPVAKAQDFEKPSADTPFVCLVAGVNGVGKTTTIGKIAYEQHLKNNKKVMMAACDTFRAAAIEQLDVWAQRASVPLVKKDIGADAAAVAFESYEKAKAEGADLLLIDTAGRLHNKANLMAELEKIVRVLKKQDENLPHAVLLVLDATTGQNAIEQVRTFSEMINVTGLVVTKLDGSAKGGVVVALADKFGLPIHMIGVGEKIEDLQPFHADEFSRSLLGKV